MVLTFLRRALVALTAGACLSSGAVTQDRAAEDFCSGPIKVAMFEFGVLYRAATQDGIDVRLLDLLAQRTGCHLETTVMPRARIWNALQAGTLDMVTGAVPTAQRASYNYVIPYLKSRNLLLYRKSAGTAPQDLADFLAGPWRLGVVRSVQHEKTYSQWTLQLRDRGRVVDAVDPSELMRFLDKGMVDAVLGHPVVYPLYVDAGWLEREVQVLDWAPREEESVGALMLSRQRFSAVQARNWAKLLASLAQDGTQYRIHRAFLPAKQARDLIYAIPRTVE